MKLTISEIAEATGVSVRTLHYYDEIGLLEPSSVEKQNGYRFYDEKSLERMQEILFYRELDFPLKDIVKILASPEYDKKKALAEQKKLLTLKKERIERLIKLLESSSKGDFTMSFKEFDNSKYEAERKKYAEEAEKKWGKTEAYGEFEKKSKGYSDEKWSDVNEAMDSLIGEFSDCLENGGSPETEEAQALVKKWQDFITENYYTCTNEILAGLGLMYTADERFKANIDAHGMGTAEFMSKAIEIYCK